MHRSWLVGLVVVASLAIGCNGGGTAGEDAGADGDGGSSDAALHQDGSVGQQDAPGVQQDAAGSACAPHQTPPTSVQPAMAGRNNCMGCHANFTIGGTLYSSLTGGSTVGGATVRIKNPNTGAVLLELVTDSAGLFYSTQAVTFPATVEVSSCPDIQTMPTTATSGNCYQSGCHSSTQRVHLP